MDHIEAHAQMLVRGLTSISAPRKMGLACYLVTRWASQVALVVKKKLPRNHNNNNKEKPWIASPNYGEIRFMF